MARSSNGSRLPAANTDSTFRGHRPLDACTPSPRSDRAAVEACSPLFVLTKTSRPASFELIYQQTGGEPEPGGLRLRLPFVEAPQSLVLARAGLDRRDVGQPQVQNPSNLGSLSLGHLALDRADQIEPA